MSITLVIVSLELPLTDLSAGDYRPSGISMLQFRPNRFHRIRLANSKHEAFHLNRVYEHVQLNRAHAHSFNYTIYLYLVTPHHDLVLDAAFIICYSKPVSLPSQT